MNLIKLCVGVEKISEMPMYQQELYEKYGKIYHQTRHFPKRHSEITNNGSLYWVIKGHVMVRQKIIGFHEHFIGEDKYCQIILDAVIIRTIPTLWRPFQGWRYLSNEQAPADIQSEDDIYNATLRDIGFY